MLKEALKKRDYSEDALILAKAATIIRNDTFRHECFKFDGNFPSKCQENSIPSSLKSLISLIYNGPNLKDQDKEESHACISVGQLIVFNMKKSTSTAGTKERHTLDREPPLPIYIGLNLHQQTRCKKLIMQLYCMGISISYDRVLDLEDRIAASVCEQCDEDGVVSPICLKKHCLLLVPLIIWITIHPQRLLSHRFMVRESVLFSFQQTITLALIDHSSHCHSLQIGNTTSQVVMKLFQQLHCVQMMLLYQFSIVIRNRGKVILMKHSQNRNHGLVMHYIF